MKNIIATTIALTIATSASANVSTPSSNTLWGGTTSDNIFGAYCTFTKNSPGSMSFHPNSREWRVTTPAIIEVESRKANNVKVEPINELWSSNSNHTTLGAKVADVTVDYSATVGNGNSSVKVTKNGIPNGNGANVLRLNSNLLEVANMKNGAKKVEVEIKIGGKATMTKSNETSGIAEDSDYVIRHNVTCTQ